MKYNEKKLHDLLIKVKDINRKHAKAAAKQKLDLLVDKRFDISVCSCSLKVFPCNDRRINCDIENCQKIFFVLVTHLVLEERAYLKDQRLKKGPKGLYQITSVDRTAIQRFKRFLQTLTQPVIDNTIAPETLPQSSIDTSSLEPEAEVREKNYTVKIILVKIYIFLFVFNLCKNT